MNTELTAEQKSHELEKNPKNDEKRINQTIFIGVAWPYANGYIHLGHVAGSLLPPDIFSRYHRMKGNRVLMVSGSDEHGTPITVRAEQEGKTPQEVVDFFHQQTKKDLSSLKIEFDLFSRTTHPTHKETVQEFFLTLLERNYIYPKKTLELYCENCERFLPDRYVTGVCPYCGNEKARGDQCDSCGKTYAATHLLNPVCKICGSTPVPRETEHFFLRLSAFEDRLLDYLKDKEYWKPLVLNFTKNWVKEGLHDRAITRDITWGVPVPVKGFEKKRIYVWFDAVIGYLSTSKRWAEEKGEPEAWKDFWLEPKTKAYYFLGKDNIPFHTIIWPAMLMGYSEGKGVDYNLPFNVPANEYLRLGGEKFTKSGGIGVEVVEFMKNFTSDEVRYYLSIIMPEIRDADFDMDDFITRINNELVATFGNFIHRVLTFTLRNFEKIPKTTRLSHRDKEVLQRIESTVQRVEKEIENCHFKNGIKEIMSLASYGNRYLVERAPWHLIKEDREECAGVMNTAMRIVKALSIIAFPYLPESMARLQDYLGFHTTPRWQDAITDFSPEQYSRPLPSPSPLYRTIKTVKEKEEERRKEGKNNENVGKQINKGKSRERKLSLKNLLLKMGIVREVKNHPNAEKLYILTVETDESEPRTLVAGLKPYYTPAELQGRRIVIVANLKPAKLRGVTSQGMLLAAEKNRVVSLLTSEKEEEPGATVVGHLIPEPEPVARVKIGEFGSMRMEIREVVGIKDGMIILDNKEELPLGEINNTGIVGKKVVIVEGNLLVTRKGNLIVPEREVPPGAVIR